MRALAATFGHCCAETGRRLDALEAREAIAIGAKHQPEFVILLCRHRMLLTLQARIAPSTAYFAVGTGLRRTEFEPRAARSVENIDAGVAYLASRAVAK